MKRMVRNNVLLERSREACGNKTVITAPLMGFPGIPLAGTTVKIAQQNYLEHFRVIRALVDRFHPDVIFPLMDLSVEANALGRYTVFPKNDSATVPRDTFDADEIHTLGQIPIEADSRVLGYRDTARMMVSGIDQGILKGAYVSGPYTLASQIMGSEDAAMATVMEPETLHRVCRLATEKITAYAGLLAAVGVDILCILEPSAVMLGPEQFRDFSGSYVRGMIEDGFLNGVGTVYHVCGNSSHLVEQMVASGISGISFDSPETGIDMRAVAEAVPDDVVVMGNVNPTAVMLDGSVRNVRTRTSALIRSMDGFHNFVLSTGCDLPMESPPENIDAFMMAARRPDA